MCRLCFCFLLASCFYMPLVRANVYFYGQAGDLLGNITPTSNCQNLPSKAFDRTRSIKADRCVMVFTDTSCLYGYSLKIHPNSSEPHTSEGDSYFHRYHFHYYFKAIRLCNEDEKLSRLQVELFTEATPDDTTLKIVGPIHSTTLRSVAAYSVNTCINIDDPLKEKIVSISNGGTCVRVYTEENCKGRSKDLRGGSTICSNDLVLCGYKVIASLQPCITRHRIQTQVYKIIVAAKPDSFNIAMVKLAEKALLSNNGSTKSMTDYNQSKSIVNSMTLHRQDMLDKIDIMSTEESTINDLKLSLLNQSFGVLDSNVSTDFANFVTSALADAHNFKNQSAPPSPLTYSEESNYNISKAYEIPPCTVTEVSSFIKVLENAELKYFVLMKITGTSNGAKMKEEDIKQHLGSNFSYIGTEDEYTVLVNTSGIIQATVGLDTVANANEYALKEDECTVSKHKPIVHLLCIAVGFALLAIILCLAFVIKFRRR